MEELKYRIQELYNEFFQKNETDPITGIWNGDADGRKLRFATMPHIGENYGKAPIKILFVGLDVGRDEHKVESKIDIISSFEYRSDCFANTKINKAPNAHTAGTFIASLHLLQDKYKEVYSKVEKDFMDMQCRAVVKRLKKAFPRENLDVLSNVALVNYYKYVTVGREKRVGNEDRHTSFNYIPKINIDNLFLSEIEILNPNIIWFQSNDFMGYDIFKKLKAMGKQIIATYHPSYLRANSPRYISEQIQKQLK